MVQKILRILYYSLFFVTPLLMFPKTSELFEFNKMLFIYAVAAGVFCVWIIKMIIYRRFIFQRTPLDIPILLFFLSQIASTIASIDRHTSFFGYYGRFNGGLLSIIAYLVLYYAFVFLLHVIRFILNLLVLSLFSSFLVILWGLPGKFGFDLSCLVFAGKLGNSCWTDQFRPSDRMFSTLGQPNWLGAYLAVHFFIGVYFLISSFFTPVRSLSRQTQLVQWNNFPLLFYTIYVILNTFSLFFTRSRSALFSVALGIILIACFFAWKKFKTVVIILLSLFILYGALQFKQIIAPVSVSSIDTNVTESLDIRKIVWKGAWDLGKKFPLFGTGVETFAYAYYFVRPAEHNLTSEWDYLYNKAHNEYLNYLATTGFVGLGAYLLFIGSVIWCVITTIKLRQTRLVQWDNETLFFVAWFTILITNFFGFSTSTINLFFYLIPAMLIVCGASEKQEKDEIPRNTWTWIQIGAVVLLFFIVPVIYLIRYFFADIYYAMAQTYSNQGKYEESSDLYKKALQLHYEHVYEDKLSAAMTGVASLHYINRASEEIIKKDLLDAEYYNTHTIQSSSYNVLYWKTRAKNYYLIYVITGDPQTLEISITALQQAEKIAPTDPKIFHFKSQFYGLLADEEKDDKKKEEYQQKALGAIDTAIRLKPNFRDGLLLKGQLLKKNGKREEANTVFRFILEKISSDDAEVKKEMEN